MLFKDLDIGTIFDTTMLDVFYGHTDYNVYWGGYIRNTIYYWEKNYPKI